VEKNAKKCFGGMGFKPGFPIQQHSRNTHCTMVQASERGQKQALFNQNYQTSIGCNFLTNDQPKFSFAPSISALKNT